MKLPSFCRIPRQTSPSRDPTGSRSSPDSRSRIPGFSGFTWWLVIVGIAFTFLLTACAGDTENRDVSARRLQLSGALRVAIDPSYPPFASLDEHEQIQGYDVDLAREVARRLGVEATFLPTDVGSIFDTLASEKADVIISAIPPYREYTRRVRYSRPYYNAGQVVLARKSDSAVVDGNLASAVVGYEFGTAGEIDLRSLPRERGMPAETRSFVSPEAGIDALAARQIDALVTDRVLARLAVRAHPELEISGPPLDVDPYVIAVRRPDVWLAERVDGILRELEREGFLAKLEDRWL